VVHLETRPVDCWGIAFHGTPRANIPSIIRNGFRVPGTEHISRFRGSYGNGIYFSAYPTFCYPYGHTWDREWNILDPEIRVGAVGILVCVVAKGNSYRCTWKEAVGSALKEGFDSHESDSGNEWVLFDAKRIVPLCLLWVKSEEYYCGTQLRNFREWQLWAAPYETVQPGVGLRLKDAALKDQGSREYDLEYYQQGLKDAKISTFDTDVSVELT